MEEASRTAELAEQPFALVSFRGKPALLADWRVDRGGFCFCFNRIIFL